MRNDMNGKLTIHFLDSNTYLPKHGQEIRYFKKVSGGFDSYGYELSYTTFNCSIAEMLDGDYTGTFISYDGNESLLEDNDHYELWYHDANGDALPEQFYWIDLDHYFRIFEHED